MVHSIGVYEGTASESLKAKIQELSEQHDKKYFDLLAGRESEDLSPAEQDKRDKLSEELNANIEAATSLDTPEARVKIRGSNPDPITLILSAYNQVEWVLDIDPGINIEEVILFGYYPQKLRSNVQITETNLSDYAKTHEYFLAFRDDRSQKYEKDRIESSDGPFCTEIKSPVGSELSTALKRIKELTGSTNPSLQGKYEGAEFEISDSTTGNLLPIENDGGYCYRDSDGVIKRLDQMLEHLSLTKTRHDE